MLSSILNVTLHSNEEQYNQR